MATERVRMWRSPTEDRILLMSGQTTEYAIEPRGEYVFGVVDGQPMRSRRGRERRLVTPGQLVAWDPSGPHAGTAIDRQPWTSRLMVIEAAALHAYAGDDELTPLTEVTFPEPIVDDRALVSRFLALHRSLEHPASRLERDERLAEWLRAVIERSPGVRRRRQALSRRDEAALRAARDYLADRFADAISLDELTQAAGIGKFRLIRLFREYTGLPPHALLVAHRIRAARHMLEAGHPIAETAAATGFADQSHLHRHLRRSLGVTPGQYQRRFVAGGLEECHTLP